MKNTITNAAIAMITGMALVGCTNESNPSGNAPQSDAHHEHDGHDHSGHDHHGHDHHGHDHDGEPREPDVYTGIKGEIISLPDPETPNSQLQIKHEQIRDFKTKDGIVNVNAKGIAGMASMTMPFPLGEGMNLDGFNVGDKVEFDFTVDWSGSSSLAWYVTRIGKLPADTVINYENVIEDSVKELMDEAHDMMDGHDHDGHDHDGP